MDIKEIIRRTIAGSQKSSLEYMKRFSLCDCMTIKFQDTYTAMGAGLELFLEKFEPGKKFLMPYYNKLPDDKLVRMRPIAYKIPKKIDTFIWSPFHEATSQYYSQGDGIRYSFRLKGGFLVQWGVAKRVKDTPKKELLEQVSKMNDKVDEVWPGAKKVIILYENSRMQSTSLKNKLEKFTEDSLKVLDWPVIQMKLTEKDAKTPKKGIGMDANGVIWNGWEHYAPESYRLVEDQLEAIEAK